MYCVLHGTSVSVGGFTATFQYRSQALAVWLLINEEMSNER